MKFLLLLLFPCFCFANINENTWRGTYYGAQPLKKTISPIYCETRTPGSFIHTVKNALTHSIITDHNIKLDRATFHENKINSVYLIHGDLWASKNSWQEHIYYFLYKFSENGITRGIWYTDDCQGLYRGLAISKKRPAGKPAAVSATARH